MRVREIMAGLAVAGLLLPEAVAYATIADLSPTRALFAGIVGCLAYGLTGQSRFAVLAPTSSSAAILAATLAAMPGTSDREAMATAAVLLTGVLFLGAALFRLGGLTSLIPRPVLRGFAFGIALTIILKQLPAMVGLHLPTMSPFYTLVAVLQRWADWNGMAIALSCAALTLFFGLRRLPALPGALIVLAAGVGLSIAAGLGARGLDLVGPVALTLDWPSLPAFDPDVWSRLVSYVLPLVLILFAESWGTMSSRAVAHGDRLTPNRELAAIGLANLASALVRGMPVGAGFSAGAAVEGAGAASRAVAPLAAVALAGFVLLARPLVAALPVPVLAAVVVGTLVHALDPAPFLKLWRLGRDLALAVAAAATVLAFGVLNGMLIAVALSLARMLHRLTSPQIARLGRLGSSRNFVDLSRHKDAVAPSGIGIWRPAEPLFFGNAAAVLDRIDQQIRDEPGLTGAVLSLEETFDLDSTVFEALVAFDRRIGAGELRLELARVHDHVRDVLRRGRVPGLLRRCHYSVDDAVAALTAPVNGETLAAR